MDSLFGQEQSELTHNRQIPDDGHVLLLLEMDEEKRTFSDYPNITYCLDNISELYEQSRASKNLDQTNYNLDQLCEWMQSFSKFTLFIYDKEIGRYKELNQTEVRERFVAQLESLENRDTVLVDGIETQNRNHIYGDDEEDEVDRTEWP